MGANARNAAKLRAGVPDAREGGFIGKTLSLTLAPIARLRSKDQIDNSELDPASLVSVAAHWFAVSGRRGIAGGSGKTSADNGGGVPRRADVSGSRVIEAIAWLGRVADRLLDLDEDEGGR
jgi:hypothetical protein